MLHYNIVPVKITLLSMEISIMYYCSLLQSNDSCQFSSKFS